MNFFDLHCDTATEAMKCHAGLCGNGLQLDLDKWQSGRLCQSYAVFIPDTLRGEAAWQYFLKCSGYWKDCIENTPDMLLLRKPAEASAQWRQKKHTCFFSVEGGAVLAGRLERIQTLADYGVRTLTLTWNGENELASGTAATGGLKPLGRDIIRELERCSIVADVSHLNDESMGDVIEWAQRPVIATHSNSRRLCNVPRNLTDDQFRCIAERRGLVGLNFFTGFLREDRKHACMEDLLRKRFVTKTHLTSGGGTMQNKNRAEHKTLHGGGCLCKPYGSAFTVGIAGCVICMIECYCDAVGGAVARLVVVDTIFHITFNAGNTAAIGRTTEIAHNYNLLLISSR